MFTNSDEVLRFVAEEGVEFIDVRFCDLPGVMQHFTVPAAYFDADVIEEGLAFDGSSVRGFQSIHESDMILQPDPATAHIDPFRVQKTLNINFFVHDPFTREAYSRDPRNVARKAEEFLASTGIADTAYFLAEVEIPRRWPREATPGRVPRRRGTSVRLPASLAVRRTWVITTATPGTPMRELGKQRSWLQDQCRSVATFRKITGSG